jgi:hypothetical protein
MRFHFLLLITMVTTLSGCSILSKKEARYLRDRDVINETVRSCFKRPYEGLSRWLPGKDISSDPNPDFPGKDHIRSYMNTRAGWIDMGSYQVVCRPASAESERATVAPAKVLEYYFGRLEMSGFTCGNRQWTTADSMQVANKSWVNKDRTLFVTGQVVSDKRTGETIISAFISGTIK